MFKWLLNIASRSISNFTGAILYSHQQTITTAANTRQHTRSVVRFASYSTKWFVFVFTALFLTNCIPPTEVEYDGVAIDINDPTTRRIAVFQDEHQTDSLLHYFSHLNPSYRYLSARAFSSFVDTLAHAPLIKLLQDEFDLVRAAAAHALGQQGNPALDEALLTNFAPDTSRQYLQANEAILAAIGKLSTEERLNQLAQVTTYQARDTALLRGQAWALFYFGRRNILSEAGTQRALELSQSTYPIDIRYPALAYLARFTSSLDSTQVSGLLKELPRTDSPDLRMLQVLAISKHNGTNTGRALLRQLARENDWRVRVNLIRGLRNYPYALSKTTVIESLGDSHQLVSETAADYILAKGEATDATTYWSLARDSFPWQTRFKLYQATNRYLPIYFTDYRGSINYQLQQRFQQTSNPYHQAAIITALGDFPWNYRTIHELGFASQHEVVRTTAVRALVYISQKSDFNTFFRNSANRVRTELSVYLQQAITTEDAGMVYEAAQALSASDNPYIGVYQELNWAKSALAALPLPAALESYRALEDAIAVLEGRAVPVHRDMPAHNRPINWKAITDAGSSPTVRIHTNRGNITLALWPEMAPGTVSSFLQLAAEGFYRDKPLHRVVPNFVVQGGDPRGDGYGAIDFSLRTETPAVHWSHSGLIGLASAGRDTEGVQFFLTHSGTPHLDGRYTAFGEVIEGQEIVDALQVGDVIERVEIR